MYTLRFKKYLIALKIILIYLKSTDLLSKYSDLEILLVCKLTYLYSPPILFDMSEYLRAYTCYQSIPVNGRCRRHSARVGFISPHSER